MVHTAELTLKDAGTLVYLYAEKESPKFERAAMRFLRRYLDEKEPTLKNFAKVAESSKSGSNSLERFLSRVRDDLGHGGTAKDPAFALALALALALRAHLPLLLPSLRDCELL